MLLKLEEIFVNNYKSFHKATIKLDDFNIIVGANNAGKTNLVDLLEFIRIAVKHDLVTAVKYKGGFEKIKNFRSRDDFVEIKAVFKESLLTWPHRDAHRNFYYVANHDRKYDLLLRFTKDREYLSEIKVKSKSKIKEITPEEFRISSEEDERKDSFRQRLKGGTFFDIDILVRKKVEEIDDALIDRDSISSNSNDFEKKGHLKKYKQISFSPGTMSDIKFVEGLLDKTTDIKIKNREKGDVEPIYYVSLLDNFLKAENEIIDEFCRGNISLDNYRSHLESNNNFENFIPRFDLGDINTFNFDVNAIRSPTKTPESVALKKDGSNLHYILNRKQKKEEFKIISASLLGIVEQVEDVVVKEQPRGTEKIPEIIFKEKDNFSVAREDISDGTLALLAILTGLYIKLFTYLVVIEEPDRHLHMNAISYLMEVFRAYSKETQLIITTHNSEVLRNANLDSDNLVFIYRDNKSMTKFLASGDIDEIKTIMEKYEYNADDIVRGNFLGYLGDYEQTEEQI